MDIDERPKTVENRARVGNWEVDLINGLRGTGNLVTLAVRMTRFVFFAYAATKEVGAVASAVAQGYATSVALATGWRDDNKPLCFEFYDAKEDWMRLLKFSADGRLLSVFPAQ